MDGEQWASRVLGADGARIRRRIPVALRAAHDALADAHESAEMNDAYVYGFVTRKLKQLLEQEFSGLLQAVKYRPGNANYTLMSVNNRILLPWRFSNSASADIDSAQFGRLTPTGREPFTAPLIDGTLFDVEPIAMEAQIEAEEELPRAIRQHGMVVPIAFSSSPLGIFRAYWGEAALAPDCRSLTWGFREQFELSRTAERAGQIAGRMATGTDFSEGPLGDFDLGIHDPSAGQ